jgi:hypothetical protein
MTPPKNPVWGRCPYPCPSQGSGYSGETLRVVDRQDGQLWCRRAKSPAPGSRGESFPEFQCGAARRWRVSNRRTVCQRSRGTEFPPRQDQRAGTPVCCGSWAAKTQKGRCPEAARLRAGIPRGGTSPWRSGEAAPFPHANPRGLHKCAIAAFYPAASTKHYARHSQEFVPALVHRLQDQSLRMRVMWYRTNSKSCAPNARK